MPRNPPEAGRLQVQPWLPVPIEVLEWHVREYLQPLVARVKVPRRRCHGAG